MFNTRYYTKHNSKYIKSLSQIYQIYKIFINNQKPPPGHPCVELFLSKLENELFSFLPGKPQACNLTKEEWVAMRSLAEDRSIIIKPADKGSCIVVWDREDYLAEG